MQLTKIYLNHIQLSEAEAVIYMEAVKRVLEEDTQAARRSASVPQLERFVSEKFLPPISHQSALASEVLFNLNLSLFKPS